MGSYAVNGKNILLHVCCAPCSGAIIEDLLEQGACLTLYFYNPNIFPLLEYARRKTQIQSFAAKTATPFIDADNDPEHWLSLVKGLELEPERGRRCQICFDMRLEKTALFAHDNGFKLFATTNGIARWKDLEQVRLAGTRAAARYPGITFLDHDWRKNGGMDRMKQVIIKEKFYQQDYCGCRFSLEQTWSRKNKKAL